MKIVFQHEHPLPVKTYGGIERIMFWHMCELVRLGHDIVLIGHPDSEVEEHGITLIPIKEKIWEHLIPHDADIIHLQYNYILPGKIPTINTIHGNGKIGEVFAKNTVFVGKRHAQIHGSDCYIHNALDLREYPYQEKSQNNWKEFLFLAKASWSVKNLKHAVKAVKKNKKLLHVVGGKTLLPSRYVKNHGFVGGQDKLDIIRQCDAMVFPVRWEEPFGIAMIEAMSQGIPVIGSKHGSLPELITDEVGITCENYDEFEAAVATPLQLEPKNIRAYVEKNFGIDTYSKKYLELYQSVISEKCLNEEFPTYQGSLKAETLLNF